MLILLNRKSLEPPLPEMAAAVIVLMITTHMRVLQPVHPGAEITIIFRQDDQMEVIGHQAIAKDRHGDFHAGMIDRLDKGMIIAILVKNLATTIAAIHHMVTNAANRGSRGPGHAATVWPLGSKVNNKHACPLFLSS
jgi:hypothetical protein